MQDVTQAVGRESEPVLILAFVVIVIGGIGSIAGALVGALLVGVIDTLGGVVLPTLAGAILGPAQGATVGGAIAAMLTYIVMASVLAFKPRGLFSGSA